MLTGLLLITLELILINGIYEHHKYFNSSVLHRIQLLHAQFIVCSFWLGMILFVQSGILHISISYVSKMVFEINTWNANCVIKKTQRYIENIARQLLVYRLINIRNIVRILKYNRYLSGIFVLFLVESVPFNCLIIIKFFYSKSLTVRIFTLVVFFEQSIVIIGIHMVIVHFNMKLTKPSKQMITHYVRNRHILNVKVSVSLCNFIETYHTKNKYGVTYWKFGLISMMTFAKVNNQINVN